VTSTAICGKSITINRDSTGGGWFDQIETRLQNPDNSRTSVLTFNNADLILSSKTSY
jgi:trimeric autotransporter adhesin